MKRREFLQWTGLTAAGTMLSACGKGTEKLIPFLIPPDDGSIPGVASYFASTCRQCPAGCGILVQTAEGRAKKIEGNPLHPVNQGKLCARGQAALQELYHPDRIRQPLKRTGERGSGSFTPVSWEEGLGLLTGQLKVLQERNMSDRLLFMTPRLEGTLHDLVRSFMNGYGSSRYLSYELLNTECYERAHHAVFGRSDLPDYDLENTQYLLSFGADFLDSWLSPVRYGLSFGKMRQARRTIRGAFTYAGARMSMTAASADLWLPVRTGEEGTLALGMARVILEQGLYDDQVLKPSGGELETWKKVLSGYDLKQVAGKTGISEEEISAVAREFARIKKSVALVGDSVAFQTNGKDAVQAVQFLNLLVGNVGQTGGLLFPPHQSTEGSKRNYADLMSEIQAMEREEVGLAMIYRTNPVHGIPPATGFQKAFRKVPFVVSFASVMDDTARQADLILPDHTDLESWGDVVPRVGVRSPVIGMLQPMVSTLYDTRSFGDVLLGAARDLGGDVSRGLDYKTFLDMLQESTRQTMNADSGPAFKKLWVTLLQKGGIFEEKASVLLDAERSTGGAVSLETPLFDGDEKDYPFHLSIFPAPSIYDGRSAHLPWLQEMPDPMTTAVWGSWVEINPGTAGSLGIKHGDLVEVESTQGRIQVPAVIFPAIRPDVVAIPLGQGHDEMGRYAKGVGVNPLSLLAPIKDETNDLPAWGATRVRLKRISDKGDLVVMGHPEGSYRGELLEI